MDQHKLNTTDFQNEIGGKSMVSMILNSKRNLSLEQIKHYQIDLGFLLSCSFD